MLILLLSFIFIQRYHCHTYLSSFLLVLSYFPSHPTTLHYLSWSYLFFHLLSHLFLSPALISGGQFAQSQPLPHSVLLTTHSQPFTWDKQKDPNTLRQLVVCNVFSPDQCLDGSSWEVCLFNLWPCYNCTPYALHALQCPDFCAYSKFWWPNVLGLRNNNGKYIYIYIFEELIRNSWQSFLPSKGDFGS